MKRARQRSLSPIGDEERRRPRYRSHSPANTHLSERSFKRSESETRTWDTFSVRGYSPTSVQKARPALPLTDNRDRFGIPIYPEEPEPHATKYGRDINGEVIHLNKPSSVSRFADPRAKSKRRYPSVPNFTTVDLPPVVCEAIDRLKTQSAKLHERKTGHDTTKFDNIALFSPNLSTLSTETTSASLWGSHILSTNPIEFKPLSDITNRPGMSTSPDRKPSKVAPPNLVDATTVVGYLNSDDLIDLSDYPATAPTQPKAIAHSNNENTKFNATASQLKILDPFQVLGIPFGSSADDILEAYESKMLDVELDRMMTDHDPIIELRLQERTTELCNARQKLLGCCATRETPVEMESDTV